MKDLSFGCQCAAWTGYQESSQLKNTLVDVLGIYGALES